MTKIALIIALILPITAGFFYFKSNQPNKKGTQNSTQAVQKITPSPSEEIVTEEVEYFKNIKGFYAAPKKPGNYAGVILIHESLGLNDHIKNMAQNLAREEHIVLAPDLYEGSVFTDFTEGESFAKTIGSARALTHIKAAKNVLLEKGAKKIATFGIGFGGHQAFTMASSGEKVDATVVYSGILSEDLDTVSKISAPVMVVVGDLDKKVTPESIQLLDTTLDKLGIENDITIDFGVADYFTNPVSRTYQPIITQRAWEKTIQFLNQNLNI